jgi:hypothetical protein
MCVCVCVCVCVFMYVCSARRTYTTYHPEIWHGLLISPGLGTKPGVTPNVGSQGYPYSDPV